MGERRTVVFFPEGAYGPTNNCVGIARILADRGVRVVFVIEESFAGTLQAKGFEEALMRLKPTPEVEQEPGQFWKDFIRETAPEFRKPTLEQVETLTVPIWSELVDGARYVDEQLAQIFDEIAPDAIVEDNVVGFPAVLASGRPWVRIMSCNPAEVKDPNVPPTFSGYPSDDRTGWDAFRERYASAAKDVWAGFDAFMQERGAPPLPEGEFIHESSWLNLSVYPEEADYARQWPLGPTWHRLDSCVRGTDAAFAWPAGFEPRADGTGALVYLSLGSLGSGDVELMDRLIGFLADSPHRVIVSKGPQAERIELAPNMWGEEFLPQTRIVPEVDVVLTHGGNNTVTECFHFGKPMVALPLFWDQYDNAQRVDELGFGVRLDPYRCSGEELVGAVTRLWRDAETADRLTAIAARLQAWPGTVRAADLIEQVAATGQPVHRSET
jgi:MGT family glycosyltransferase